MAPRIIHYRSVHADPPTPSGFRDRDVEWFPAVQVRLAGRHSKPSHKFLAIVDTGSPFCFFDANLGRAIGLDVESGEEYLVAGIVVGPEQPAHFHRITLTVEDAWTVEIWAGFLDGFGFSGVLGRRGFFENFTVKFDHSMHPPFWKSIES